MRTTNRMRVFASLAVTFCLLVLPLSAFGRKKGNEHFKKGMDYEQAKQWDKAAQEFTLALAANPSDPEFQLHFKRATFNASQAFMQQGRALADQRDYVGAFNAFRQAYGYDPVNQLAVSEMDRMLRLQAVKDGTPPPSASEGEEGAGTPSNGQAAAAVPESAASQTHSELVHQVSYSGDLKAFIRTLADQLNLNVVFDKTSFAQPRQIDINLKDVTTAQTMDYIFLQESLFFQKLSRRTILVADQNRRAQYQQLVLRTFFLSNTDPQKASELIRQAIPPSVGRPQTIVVPDKDTNTLTVRDTAENVRLIGDLLTSIDKDRPEVVMDVNIYEVSTSDLMQLGNQVGDATTLTTLGGFRSAAATFNGLARVVTGTGLAATSLPASFGAALILPQSAIQALQTKSHSRLIASTQVHAFNNEESTARIGQRVPVQTAQAYPFGTNTGGTTTSNGFPSGGFPVINYEPTGLTLKFTPLVYPNFDVQVKMSIESKDVSGAQTITPTFTERTITGTARVQNNRTMLLASVSTEAQSNGTQGLPVLGLIPVLGRMFTAPTKENRQIDIVIAVTPRVLRAPAVTPRDEMMRPSGTLSNPTLGSLEAMVRDADHEDQIIAMRRLPRNSNLQLPDAEPGLFAALKNAALPVSANPQAPATGSQPLSAAAAWSASVSLKDRPNVSAVNNNASAQVASQPATEQRTQASEEPNFVPAPKSLINSQSAAEVAAINTGAGGNTNAVLTSAPQPIDVSLETSRMSRIAQLKLATTDEALKVGEKRRIAVELSSEVPLGLALLALKFDPKVIAVRAVTAGPLFGADSPPNLNQSIDPTGVCMITIATLNGAHPFKGSGVFLFIEIEGIAPGDGAFGFDKDNMHLVATDAGDVVLALSPGRTLVKQ